jgi:hypothetical protein
METSTNGDSIVKEKKVIDRSASYPSVSLDEAIQFTLSVAKSFPTSQPINRDDIATVLKKKAASIQRDVATAAQYGLFDKVKDGYIISELFRAIKDPLDEKEKRKSIITAFKSPKLYRELIEKYDNHAVPELRPILIRFHNISEKAADDAAEVFINNATWCGVLNDSNILSVTNTFAKLSDSKFEYAEVVTIEPPPNGEVVNIDPKDQKPNPQHLLPPKNESEEQLKIRLSGNRYAYLNYPTEITAKDIEILKKQIEVLELTLP